MAYPLLTCCYGLDCRGLITLEVRVLPLHNGQCATLMTGLLPRNISVVLNCYFYLCNLHALMNLQTLQMYTYFYVYV